jgi:hypothetical protein
VLGDAARISDIEIAMRDSQSEVWTTRLVR